MYNKIASPVNSTNAAPLSSPSVAVFDPLTNLYNKPLFIQVMESLLKISMRQKMPVSLAIMSIDHYARIGNKYGPQKTNHLIQKCADLIKSISRDSDVLSHFDDDTFAFLLYNCSYQSSKIVAERLHNHIEGHIDINHHPITISVGTAEFNEKTASIHTNISDELLSEALKALDNEKKIKT